MSYLKKSPSRQASIEYVSGLSSLLYLRGLNHADHFILAANLGGVGAFGDNVFLYRESERVAACFFHMLQAARVGAAPKLSGELFSYFVSFRKIQSALPWLEEQLGEEIEQVELICYTDAQLSTEASYSHADHIADGGGLVCGPAVLERAWELCDEMNKYWEFLVDIAYDISEGVEEATLIASTEMFKSVVASEEILQRVENLRNDLGENCAELLMSEMGGEVDRMDFKEFLEKFKVFHCQPDEIKLMELVKDEFLKLSGANSDSGAFSEEQLAKSLDETFSSFLKGICKWVEEGDDWYSRYSQVWANVVTEVVRLVGDPMLKALASFDVKFIEDSLENLSEVILENSVVCVDCQSENTVLNLVKVHNVLEGLMYFLLNIGSLIKYRSLVVMALERFWCSVLVIDITGAQISELCITLSEIHRALSLNHDARLILVARNSKEVLIPCLDMLEIKYENYVDIISWNSFSASCQTTLLNKLVHFQGVETTLGTLLGPYSEIFSEFQGDFLHSILTTKDMVVGCDLPAVADYFPRTLSRSVSFNMTILRSKIANTLLALTGASLAEVIQVIPEGENYHIYDPKKDTMDTFEGLEIIVIENESDEQPFSEIAADGNMSVHFFVLSDEKLSWKWSIGNMSTLDPYLLREKADRFHIDDATSSPEKLTIVTGEEDTGKTTFLRHVARGTKESNANLWVVCLNLPEHEDFINNTLFDNPEELYPLLRELATFPYDSVLSDMLFMRYWRDGNIAIFIDGFENVPWHLTGQITDMIKLVRSKARSVFVGCRSKIKNALCGNLCTFAFSLLPIGEDDQRRFLFKKWGNKVTDNNRLGVFVEAIMVLLRNSVGQQDEKLCCPPLLTAIVAHAFSNELLAFATSGNIAVPKKLNLIHFYEKYVEKCCYDFLMKRAATDTLTQQLLIENKLRLMDRYMILAVMLLIPKEDIKQMTVISAQYQNYKDLRRLKQSSGEGSLITLINDYPVFVHRTLPEYFLATWLSEVFVSTKEFVEERFLEPRYVGVRLWLDRVLARKQELHWAVLNDDEAAAGALLAAGAPVNAADEGGRTALHLAAAHDMPHMVGLLLVAGADVGLADGVLGWRALRYADRVRAWGALDRLLPAAGKAARQDLVATGRVLDSEVLLNAALVGACERGHVRLLEYFHAQGVELKKVIDFEGSTALHIAAENGRTEMVKYLLLREMDEQTDKTLCHNFLRVFKGDARRVKPDVNVQRNDGSSAVILAAQEGHADTLQTLFHFEASANIKKLNGSTALHAAVAENHIEAARVLLEAGAEVDREDGEGTTPLHAAATEGHAGLVRLLLERGAAVGGTDNAGASALHWAAAGGHLRCAEALERAGAHVNAKDADLCTPLHWAAMEGQSAVVRFLLAKGAEVKIVNRAGGTAVHAAARENRPGTLHTFKNAGVDLNLVNPDGTTPLHWACNKGHDAAAMCLLELGADLDTANYDGYTALHLAALRGHTSLVQRLLAAGAKPDGGQGGRRAPPLHLAAKGEHAACVRALLDAGATVNARDPVGATALHWASWCGHEDTLHALVRAGADTALADNHGSAPLHWAAGEGHARAAAALVAAGADPDAVNRDGDAPLHWAAKEGHAGVVAALLEAGADPAPRNGDGIQPARLAAGAPHSDIVHMLEEWARKKEAGGHAPAGQDEKGEGDRTPEAPTRKRKGLTSSQEQHVTAAVHSNQQSMGEQTKDEDEEMKQEENEDDVQEEQEEKFEALNPHTTSLFQQKSLFDWGDDDKSKVSLIRLSVGVSEYNRQEDKREGSRNVEAQIPPTHQPMNIQRGKSNGPPVPRRISKVQFNEKVAVNRSTSTASEMNEEQPTNLEVREVPHEALKDRSDSPDEEVLTDVTNSELQLNGVKSAPDESEVLDESENDIPPLPTSPPPPSSNDGSMFGALFDAGSNLMRYARIAVGSETPDNTHHTSDPEHPEHTQQVHAIPTISPVDTGVTKEVSDYNATLPLSAEGAPSDANTSQKATSPKKVDHKRSSPKAGKSKATAQSPGKTADSKKDPEAKQKSPSPKEVKSKVATGSSAGATATKNTPEQNGAPPSKNAKSKNTPSSPTKVAAPKKVVDQSHSSSSSKGAIPKTKVKSPNKQEKHSKHHVPVHHPGAKKNARWRGSESSDSEEELVVVSGAAASQKQRAAAVGRVPSYPESDSGALQFTGGSNAAAARAPLPASGGQLNLNSGDDSDVSC